MMGKPTREKSLNVMIFPCLFNIFTPTRLAAAAINVAFPPKQAPRDKAHQIGLRLKAVASPMF